MSPQEMRDILIGRFVQKNTSNLNNYRKKIAGMTNTLLQQEYDIVILGKKYELPKKPEKKSKKVFKEKITYEKEKDDDLKRMW